MEPSISVVIMVNSVLPIPAKMHNHLRPHSLEDRTRIKQLMIHSHELDEIAREAYVDFLLPTEQYLMTSGFPLYPKMELRSMIVNEMHAYLRIPRNYMGSCSLEFLKMMNLTMALKNLMDLENHEECGSRMFGFFFSSPPFVVPAMYTILPIATAFSQGQTFLM